MRRDPTVFGIGEDVAEAGHPFKVLLGLAQEFGSKRIIDTPIRIGGVPFSPAPSGVFEVLRTSPDGYSPDLPIHNS